MMRTLYNFRFQVFLLLIISYIPSFSQGAAEIVDLGLSVKWASWNIGASKPEGIGYHFSWGETAPKSNYDVRYYKFGNPPSKYNSNDNKTQLEPVDDAAALQWGGYWRMPTQEEEKELRTKCKWKYVVRNGVKGYNVEGPNGKSIFLPFTGIYDGTGGTDSLAYSDTGGWYWSSNALTSKEASGLYMTSSEVSYNVTNHVRWDGHAIRPVYDDRKTSGWKMLGNQFDRSIPIRKIRVRNTRATNDQFCCVFFSTMPNDSSEVDTYYNINFWNLTIGDNSIFTDGVSISSCKSVGDNWYEYDFSRTVYFSQYQTYVRPGSVMTYVATEGSKRSIYVSKAGTLSNLIPEEEMYMIDDLTLTGKINGTDFRLLRQMAGKNTFGGGLSSFSNTEGQLSKLDISGVSIVPGGEYMSWDNIDNYVSYSLTNYNEIPPYVFNGCTKLKTIKIPNAVNMIGGGAFDGTTWYNNQSNGLVYIGKMLYKYKGSMSQNTRISLSNGTVGIACGAFEDCTNLISIEIPNSVTNIGGYYSSIDYVNATGGLRGYKGAFSGCTGLTSITIPGTVTSLGWNTFYNCTSLTEISIPSSITKIGFGTFYDCKKLSDISLPNTLKSIEDVAFYGCTNLISITIPSNVTSFGNYAFSGCSNLECIKYHRTNPYEIHASVFDPNNYRNSFLIVPQNARNTYYITKGWGDFVNVFEETLSSEIFVNDGVLYQCSTSNNSLDVLSARKTLKSLEIPQTITRSNGTYSVESIGDNAFEDCEMNYLSLPSSITSVTNNAFKNSDISSIIWQSSTSLPANAFTNSRMSTDSNFLLYVNSASLAPSSVKNVIVNNVAESITLAENGERFYCPKSFTAKKISFTHNYKMVTGGGKGWETIVLPFTVQKINHSTKGELIPFGSYVSSSSKKPFWLNSFSNGSFQKASSIQANIPYIIAMPNQSNYQADYNLAGEVTFSSTDVQIPITPEFSGAFRGTYAPIPQSSSVFALNASNDYVNSLGNYEAGSRFIRDLRDIRPFEAYIYMNSTTRSIFDINIDGTTDLDDLTIEPVSKDKMVSVYTLSGQMIGTFMQSQLDHALDNLPHGVYIVNGKKIIR